MPGDRKPPPFPRSSTSGEHVRRSQTQTERDEASYLAKLQRDRAPVVHVADLAMPHEVEDAGTGVLEGEDLRRKRESREPLDRIRHLEDRLDEALADRDAMKARLNDVEKSRDDLLNKLVDMGTQGFSAGLGIGKANADDKLKGNVERRSLIGKVVLGLLALLTTLATGFALGSRKP